MSDLIDRQAAIKTLEKGLPSEPLKSKYTEGITVGFGLAITWIEQLPAVQTCDDAVSRAELLDSIERMHRITDETANGIVAKAAITAIKYFRDIVNALPAVQPQTEEDCDTCKHGYFGDRQCDNCRVRYPSHYEREEEQHGSDGQAENN